MAANGKQRQYTQVGTAVLDAETGELVRRIARDDERPLAFVIRKLIEASPRIVQMRKNGKRHAKTV